MQRSCFRTGTFSSLLLAGGLVLWSPPGAAGAGGLFFDGADDHVTFGVAPSLGVSNFTVECWFKRQGTGATANTGTGGVDAYPLITKGRGENENGATNCNYFFGIGTGNMLVADFEDFNNGLNHPVVGTAQVGNNVWQHAAATYGVNSGTWVLYLNGVPDVTNVIAGAIEVRTPRYDSIQHAALATALITTGAAQGFFNGTLDEVRVWNYARSAPQIAGAYQMQIASAPGLIARWSLDDASGATATNSIGGGVAGALVNGPVWTNGYPFSSGPPNLPPDAPAPLTPANGATGVTNYPVLSVSVSDPDTNTLTVTFFGRVATTSSLPDFTLVAMPDTQFYVSSLNGGSPAILNSQTAWIVNHRADSNIVFVTQLGDCVQNGDNGGNDVEWHNATNAYYQLENPATTLLAEGIPYGIAVGNHDQGPTGNGDPNGTTTFYNQYFGAEHFSPYSYYAGHYGTNNDNHFELFKAGGMDFIIIHLEYDPAANPDVLAWASGLLQVYSSHHAIVVSHWIINAGFSATFSAQGQAIYNALKGNPNLFLMLCGHVTPEEGQRQDTFNGRTVWTVLSDYQSRAAGGNGWMRLYQFSPTNNVIRVKTISPWLNQSETDADSQFDIPYSMMPPNPFTLIGTSAGVSSGGSASATWSGLQTNTTYEWFATVSDGQATNTGPVWRFTTGTNAGPIAPTVTLTNPASGSTFVAPANITLAAAASDSDGSVTNVAFYQGATKLADDASSPFSFSWNGVGVGSYALKAVATDNSGLNATSAVVNVTVNPTTTVTRGPYLQNGSHTSVTVRWRTAAATDSRVLYGTSAGNLTQSVFDGAGTTEHEIKLTGLLPEMKYFYSVGTGSAALAGGGVDFFFVTAPLPGTDKPTRIWVLGDAGTKTANQVAVRDAYYNFTGARHTDLWLMLGDNAYEVGSDSDYQAAVFDMYPAMLRKSVLWSTLGNHETAQGTAFVDTYPYFTIFTLPRNGEAGGVASGTEHYYSFNYANIHFICLDSMTASRAANGAMAMWLSADLANVTADWTIAFWHHPPYTKGSHNSDTETPLIEMRQNLLPLLEAAGVDLVLTGHSHSYERSFLLDGHYGLSTSLQPAMKLDATSGREDATGAYRKPSGGPVGHQGAVYVVAGSSGQISGGSLNHPAMFISLNNLGSLVLDIASNRLDAKFIRENATTNDYFTILKVNYPPVASNYAFAVKADNPTNLTLRATDLNRDPLTFATTALPEHGLISDFNPAAGTLTYTPAHGYSGPDYIGFRVSDGQFTSPPGAAAMTVVFFPDNNGNGIPDVWETLYGITDPNGDADSDGLLNRQEYLANTIPTNAASRLILTSASVNASAHATISWQSIGGTRYRVSYADGGLGGFPTTQFTDIIRPVADEMDSDPVGSPSTQTYTDNLPPAPNSSRFFRIKVVQ